MALTRFRNYQLRDFDYKNSVRVATTTAVTTLAGGAPDTVDTISLSAGDRVLVKDQATASQNGIYDVTTVGTGSNGTWTRSSDANGTQGLLTSGATVYVSEGSTNGGKIYRLTTVDPITIGTTSQVWATAATGGNPGGSNTHVQFNYVGAFEGSPNLTWNGSTLSATLFNSTQSSGNEGGQIDLAAPAANTTITTGVSIDVYQDRLRIFESGGTNRGAFIDISTLAAGVNLDLATSIVNGNSNVKVAANGNITISSTGTANVLVISGTGLTATGLIDIDNIRIDANTISSINTNGNINLSPNGTGNIVVTAAVLPNANATLNLGSSSLRFSTIYGTSTSAQYADLAERYLADIDYPVGTVLKIGGAAEVTVAEKGNVGVVGTVSENPGFLMNDTLEGDYLTSVAYIGRVPCRVNGEIKRGDLLAVGDTAGVATSVTAQELKPGTLVGKALQAYNNSEEGIIEILVGRQ